MIKLSTQVPVVTEGEPASDRLSAFLAEFTTACESLGWAEATLLQDVSSLLRDYDEQVQASGREADAQELAGVLKRMLQAAGLRELAQALARHGGPVLKQAGSLRLERLTLAEVSALLAEDPALAKVARGKLPRQVLELAGKLALPVLTAGLLRELARVQVLNQSSVRPTATPSTESIRDYWILQVTDLPALMAGPAERDWLTPTGPLRVLPVSKIFWVLRAELHMDQLLPAGSGPLAELQVLPTIVHAGRLTASVLGALRRHLAAHRPSATAPPLPPTRLDLLGCQHLAARLLETRPAGARHLASEWCAWLARELGEEIELRVRWDSP